MLLKRHDALSIEWWRNTFLHRFHISTPYRRTNVSEWGMWRRNMQKIKQL